MMVDVVALTGNTDIFHLKQMRFLYFMYLYRVFHTKLSSPLSVKTKYVFMVYIHFLLKRIYFIIGVSEFLFCIIRLIKIVIKIIWSDRNFVYFQISHLL